MSKPKLSQAQLDHLANVIGEMESRTSGEIRLMIVKRSSAIGHVPFQLWSLLLALSFVGIWFGRHEFVLIERWWMWPGLFVSNYFLAWALAHSRRVQRWLTPYADLHHQVWARAEVEFSREILGQTRSRTGILLFLSVMERQAVVIADKGIAGKVPSETWQSVVNLIVEGARTGRWAAKFEEAIRKSGSILAAHLPQELDDSNELPNTVIIKD